MDIFEKLNSVNTQMKKDLEEEKRKEEEERKRYEQIRKEREEEIKRMEENDEIELEDEEMQQEKEKIKAILADNTEGIDEPHWYIVTWKYYEYGRGAIETEFELIMTEREKMLTDVTNWLEQYLGEYIYDKEYSHEILNVEKLNRKMTREEEIKLNAVKEKIKFIKEESEEGNKDVIVDFYHDDFEEEEIAVKTTLKQALLTQVSEKEDGNYSGKIRGLDKLKNQQKEEVVKKEVKEEKEEETKEETKDEILPAKPKSKVTFASIKEAFGKFLNRGER